MSLFGSQNNRDGAGLPMPEGGIRRYLLLLTTHFWKLLGLNLLFLLFSLPVITLPAALCAMNRVCMLLIRNGYCFAWQDFRQEFRRSFLRSLLPALFFAGLLFFGYYAMSLGLTNAGLPLWSMLFWSIGIGVTVAGLCWGSYFFALVSLLEQGNRGILKNAWLLCMLRPGKALTVFVIIAAAGFTMAVLMPVSILLMAVCTAVLVLYTVCFLVNDLAEAYILIQNK